MVCEIKGLVNRSVGFCEWYCAFPHGTLKLALICMKRSGPKAREPGQAILVSFHPIFWYVSLTVALRRYQLIEDRAADEKARNLLLEAGMRCTDLNLSK